MIDTAESFRTAIPYKIESLGQGMLLAHCWGAQRNNMRELSLIAADWSPMRSGAQAPYAQLPGGINESAS